MIQLKVLCVLSAILITAVTSQDPTCTDAALNATMMKCYEDEGISSEDAVNFLPSNGFVNVSAEDIQKECEHQQQYARVAECVSVEFDRCHPNGVPFMPDLHKAAVTLGVICNDTDFNITCMVEVDLHPEEVKACFISKMNYTQEASTKTEQELFCETSIVGSMCGAETIRKCDAHTADVFESMEKLSMPAFCSDYPGTAWNSRWLNN